MKKLLVILAVVATSYGAVAERGDTGVVFVRTATEAALEPKLLDTAEQINKGRYPQSKFNDSCGGSRRKVYSIEIGGKRYRSDRNGNLTPYWVGFIKYAC
jgi:hypothetical protein